MSKRYTMTITVEVTDEAALMEAAREQCDVDGLTDTEIADFIVSPEAALVTLLDRTIEGAGYNIEDSHVEEG